MVSTDLVDQELMRFVKVSVHLVQHIYHFVVVMSEVMVGIVHGRGLVVV